MSTDTAVTSGSDACGPDPTTSGAGHPRPSPAGEGPVAALDRPPRVFCIGLNKTGTTSLARAFALLGLRAWHDAAGAAALIEHALAQGLPLLAGFDDYDCYADKPFAFWYRRLDAEYPGSRFILNTRDTAAWIDSRIAHTAHWNAHQRGTDKPPRRLDPDHEVALKTRVEAEIRAYFATAPERFIEIDVCAGQGWNELCPFLGRSPPTDANGRPLPFPFRNRRSSSA
jgi:hypothetical protein